MTQMHKIYEYFYNSYDIHTVTNNWELSQDT